MKSTNFIKKSDVKRIRYTSARGTQSSTLPYDKPFTKICSFQSDCRYSCSSTHSSELNLDTTDPKLLKPMFQKIAPYIETYLLNRSSFTIDELIESLAFLKVHKYMIYMTIDYMIVHLIYFSIKMEFKGNLSIRIHFMYFNRIM